MELLFCFATNKLYLDGLGAEVIKKHERKQCSLAWGWEREEEGHEGGGKENLSSRNVKNTKFRI